MVSGFDLFGGFEYEDIFIKVKDVSIGTGTGNSNSHVYSSFCKVGDYLIAMWSQNLMTYNTLDDNYTFTNAVVTPQGNDPRIALSNIRYTTDDRMYGVINGVRSFTPYGEPIQILNEGSDTKTTIFTKDYIVVYVRNSYVINVYDKYGNLVKNIPMNEATFGVTNQLTFGTNDGRFCVLHDNVIYLSGDSNAYIYPILKLDLDTDEVEDIGIYNISNNASYRVLFADDKYLYMYNLVDTYTPKIYVVDKVSKNIILTYNGGDLKNAPICAYTDKYLYGYGGIRIDRDTLITDDLVWSDLNTKSQLVDVHDIKDGKVPMYTCKTMGPYSSPAGFSKYYDLRGDDSL